jgi:hypothetical protein
MTENPSSVLLYPNIELKDPILVKEALLLYDNLYRIVPSDYKPNDHPEIQECNVDFEIVAPIYPEEYIEGTYQKFQTKVKKWSPLAAGFSPAKIARSDKLHEGKVYYELRKYFLDEGLLIKDGRWLRGNNALIANYMIFLSNEIAAENHLGLLTNNSPAWTTQEFVNYDGNYARTMHGDDFPYNALTRSLVGVYLTDFIPKNLEKIPFSEIMTFRDEYQQERINFLREQSRFIQELQTIKDPLVFKDRVMSLQARMKISLNDYRDSCKKLGPKHFFGAKVVTVPFITPIAAYVLSHDPELTAALSAIGITFGALWSLHSYQDDLDTLRKTNAYSYLDILQKYSFKTIKKVNSQLSTETMEFMLD